MTGAAQWAGALALLLSFALMYARTSGVALRICALQGLSAVLAAGVQAWAQAATQAGLVVMLAAALNGVAMPLVLQRLTDRPGAKPIPRKNHGVRASVAAVALVTISVVVATRVLPGTDAPIFAGGLSILLLGLLLAAVRPTRNMPAFGLLSAQNGMVLAASVVPGLPTFTFLACVIPLVPGLLAADMWLRRADRPRVAPR